MQKAHYSLARVYLAIGDKRAAFEQSKIAGSLDQKTVAFDKARPNVNAGRSLPGLHLRQAVARHQRRLIPE